MSDDFEDRRQLAEDQELARRFAAGEIAFDLTAPAPDLPPPLAPGDEPKVVMSVRLPTSLYLAIREAAQDRGVKTSDVVREWLALQRIEQESDRLVRIGDLRRALIELPRAS
jgi:hypothetical protein